MNKTKRLLALVLALVMSLTLFACGRKAQDDKTDDSTRTEDTTRVFTDSCGREVTVPTDIQKVAVSGPLAQMVVFAIAPDKMVGGPMPGTRPPRITLTRSIWTCPCWASCTAARAN